MTIEERLRAAAGEIRRRNLFITLEVGTRVDELMVEAADEIRRIHETFGRTLLDEPYQRLMTFFGEQLVEAAKRGALDHVGTCGKEFGARPTVGVPGDAPAPAMVTMGPIEAGFYARHLRHIDIAGYTVCQGGAVRCDDCRCGIPEDWREQDAKSIQAGKKEGGS